MRKPLCGNPEVTYNRRNEFTMKKYSLLSLLMLFTLVLTRQTSAQTACTTFYSSQDVIALEEDSTYLWLGTFADGLIRWEKTTGNTVVYNRFNSDLPQNYVKGLLYLNNKLYVSTDSSLLNFNGTGFTMINDTIEGVLRSNGGDLHVIGRRMYHLLLNDTIFYSQSLTALVGDACCSENNDAILDSGDVWIAHHDFYIFNVIHFDQPNWRYYDWVNYDLPIESFQRNGIAATPEGIFTTTWAGMYKYTRATQQWALYHRPDSMPTIVSGNDTLQGALSGLYSAPYDPDFLWVGNDGGTSWPVVSGSIAYQYAGQWTVVPNVTPTPQGINTFLTSRYETDMVYAGTTEGFIKIDKNCLLTSTESPAPASKLTLYPNPAQNQIQLKGLENGQNGTVRIVDLMGREMKRSIISEGAEMTIQIADLPAGRYFCVVSTPEAVQTLSFIRN